MRVENMENSRGNVVKNQFLIKDTEKGTIIFQSYDSKVCTWSTHNKKLILNGDVWDYSNTTRKFFKQFLESYTNIKYISKQDFLKLLETKNNNIIIEE